MGAGNRALIAPAGIDRTASLSRWKSRVRLNYIYGTERRASYDEAEQYLLRNTKRGLSLHRSMHKNELVNVLSAALADMRRHQERLAHLTSPRGRASSGVDAQDAADVARLLQDIVRELDEAITQRSISR